MASKQPKYPYRVQGYLKPRQKKLFEAERMMLQRSESEHLARLVDDHQQRMTENNRQQLLEYYEKHKPNK